MLALWTLLHGGEYLLPLTWLSTLADTITQAEKPGCVQEVSWLCQQ